MGGLWFFIFLTIIYSVIRYKVTERQSSIIWGIAYLCGCACHWYVLYESRADEENVRESTDGNCDYGDRDSLGRGVWFAGADADRIPWLVVTFLKHHRLPVRQASRCWDTNG